MKQQKHTVLNRLVIIKVDASIVNLISDIALVAKEVAAKEGMSIKDLSFGERNKLGFRLLSHKPLQFGALTEIVERARRKHPSYETSVVVDLVSELVNCTVYEITAFTAAPHWRTPEENAYLNQSLITVYESQESLPRYPWYMPIEAIEQDIWLAKDLTSGTTGAIVREKKGNFYQYEFSPHFIE